MNPIEYIDRKDGRKKRELVYHEKSLQYLYGDHFFSHFLLLFIAKIPFLSFLVGSLQSLPTSRSKIAPFIEKYGIDSSEFVKKVEAFDSFNDFFTRELKAEARPIATDEKCAIIPADGRYLFYENIETCDGFLVKGKKFSLLQLLNNEELEKRYRNGSMVIARLCPTDYHRFHFPVDCFANDFKLINGSLYSVNPVALKKNINYLAQNKRVITQLETENFGKVLFIEIGATFVGTIHQTYQPKNKYKKGDEKGFFSFGGSSIILLFEQNQIKFDFDLLSNSSQYTETLCLMGQSMGSKKIS